MKKSACGRTALPVFIILAALTASCSKGPAIEEPGHGESILDRVEHIEPALATAVPETFRWCDRLPGLDKRRIDVGGAELYVEAEGKGTPIVLINGGPGGTHHGFHPWFSRLRKGARVVYYDQRGCGLSDYRPGDKGYSVEQAVGDLEAVRKALGFEAWVVLGYSYGGFLAQLYTVLHPDRVAGLVLLGASLGMRADDGPSRQGDYISKAEKSRMAELGRQLTEYAKANGLPRQKVVELGLYNNFLNGDWKRQYFYKPSPDRMAQIALYEWAHDEKFRGGIGQSLRRWDFTGAFAGNPVPTLILEGLYDLTWSEKKKDILKANHPNGRMVVFPTAAHSVYKEDPDGFFRALKDFLKGLGPVDAAALASYRAFLDGWIAAMKARPDIVIDTMSMGPAASRELAGKYSPDWLGTFSSWWHYSRTGFALYDVKRYAEALAVFERFEAKFAGNPEMAAVALIWQGHMLDLMGKRSEARGRYRRAAEMDIDEIWSYSQYGLRFSLSPYARERLKTPFKRVENTLPD